MLTMKTGKFRLAISSRLRKEKYKDKNIQYLSFCKNITIFQQRFLRWGVSKSEILAHSSSSEYLNTVVGNRWCKMSSASSTSFWSKKKQVLDHQGNSIETPLSEDTQENISSHPISVTTRWLWHVWQHGSERYFQHLLTRYTQHVPTVTPRARLSPCPVSDCSSWMHGADYTKKTQAPKKL